MDWLHAFLLTARSKLEDYDVLARLNGGLIHRQGENRFINNGKRNDLGVEGTAVGQSSTVVVSPIVNRYNRKKTLLPKHCHTYASSKGISSMRTQSACGAFIKYSKGRLLKRNTLRNRIKTRTRKANKQCKLLQFVEPTNETLRLGKIYDDDFLSKNVLVFDGGDRDVPKLMAGAGSAFYPIRIIDGGLVVVKPANHHTGLSWCGEDGQEPPFILVPRSVSLELNSSGKEVVNAMRGVAETQKNLKRGGSKQVFTDDNYVCIGSKPIRVGGGVTDGCYNVDDGCDKKDWNTLFHSLKLAEQVMCACASTEVVNHVEEAKKMVDWKRAKSTYGETAQYYNGIAFGRNAYLRAHRDEDFTLSVTQIHMDREYGVDDRPVSYFCFPQLGVAVPLCPGDYLLFNAREPHCVSKRCRDEDDIYSMSFYLKTAVVGGHCNKLPLNKNEKRCLEEYWEYKSRKR